jgi:hypothetical protein
LAKNAEQREKLKGKSGNAGKEIHAYKLEDYGLNSLSVKAKFADYITAYC